MTPSGSSEGFRPSALQNVVILQIPARRSQRLIALFVGLTVAVFKQVILQL